MKNSTRRNYYNQCPHCGANLDPGEKCECLHRVRQINKPHTAIFCQRKTGHISLAN